MLTIGGVILSKPFGYSIKLINKQLSNKKNCDIKKYGITSQQFEILMHLYKNQDKNIFQKDIEQKLEITGATATGLINRLEQNGYIERKVLGTDSRYKVLILTNKAIELGEDIAEILKHHEEIIFDGFSEEEKRLCEEFMDRILDNLVKEIEQ